MKNPKAAKKFLNNLPVYDAKDRHIVMKPVTTVDEGDDVKSIVFVANADQIAALSTLANYTTGNVREGLVVVTGAAGCQAMGVYTYAEGESRTPRAVVGLTDLSALMQVRNVPGRDVLIFSVPFSLYERMERDVPGSFLSPGLWKGLRDSRKRSFLPSPVRIFSLKRLFR